jgi:hypothetical protein
MPADFTMPAASDTGEVLGQPVRTCSELGGHRDGEGVFGVRTFTHLSSVLGELRGLRTRIASEKQRKHKPGPNQADSSERSPGEMGIAGVALAFVLRGAYPDRRLANRRGWRPNANKGDGGLVGGSLADAAL